MAPPNEGKPMQRVAVTPVEHPGDRLGTGSDQRNPSFIEDPTKIPIPGPLGIRWARTEGEIGRLNALVDAKCKYFVELSKKTGEAVPPEVQYVLDTGKPSSVYKERVTSWPVIMGTLHVCNIAYCAYHFAVPTLAAALFSYFYYDLFSGVLHIVHDNPIMMKIPVICDPTLEFQWHHHIPSDLTSKSFLEVCGDLNMVTFLITMLYVNPFGPYCLGTSNMALCLISCKLVMAYFGQLCHAMSHMPFHRRPKWVVSLQNYGVMVHPKEHWGHHKNYDDNYCIGSGLFNRLLTPFLKFTDRVHIALGSNLNMSAYCWLAGFLAMAVFDIPVLMYIFIDKLQLGPPADLQTLPMVVSDFIMKKYTQYA